MRARGAEGFTLVEMLVAAGIFLAAAGVLFHLAAGALRLSVAGPEAADVNQRIRGAAGRLTRDLAEAGSADAFGRLGTLANYFPPIVPARTGAIAPDPDLTAFDDRITIVYVPRGGTSVNLAADMAGTAVDVALDTATPGCAGHGICGFAEGDRAAILNASSLGAGYDLFTVTSALAGLGHGPPNLPFSQAYTRATARVVPVVHRVYYLDRAASRLMVYDGFKSVFPLIDNVVHLEFAYFGDPHPASVASPAEGSGNCVYTPGDPPAPLLPPLGTSTLAPMPVAQFTDGPYCGVVPNRFDADLLRIRRVRVRLRVQAAPEQVRGRGPHFVNPGLAGGDFGAVRDFEVTFDVAPRNLRPVR